LQLTAFGARDRWHFSALLCGAPRRQLKRKPLGRTFNALLIEYCYNLVHRSTEVVASGGSMSIALPQRTPCPFCEYITGSRRWAIIFRNTLIASFVNTRQYTKGAILIIPLRHAPTIFELTREELCAIGQHAQELTSALQYAYQPSGYNIFQNNGLAAGQSIPHYHLHIVPRYGGEEGNRIFGEQNMEKTPLNQQLVIAKEIQQQLRTSA